MKYQDIIETVSEIAENDKICKKGLILTYTLSEVKYRQMNEELFYTSNDITTPFKMADDLEIKLGGITVKIMKEEKIEDETYKGNQG